MPSTVHSSSTAPAGDARTPHPALPHPAQRIVDALLSGEGLRLALIAGAVFLAWSALRGLRPLFWVAFGLSWMVAQRGGLWF